VLLRWLHRNSRLAARTSSIILVLGVGSLWLAGRAFRLGMLRYGQRLRLAELFRREVESMNKTLLVLRHEIFTVVSRPSFLFGVFGIPLLGALAFFVAGRINQDQSAQSVVQQIMTNPPEQLAEGYVDQAGIIQALPAGMPEGLLVAYPDEAAARAALDAGEIGDYYIVPADYIASGEIIQVRPDFNPLSGFSQSDMFEWVVRVNLLGGDAQLAALSNGPLDLEQVNISRAAAR
jgi:hypothetical protein